MFTYALACLYCAVYTNNE